MVADAKRGAMAKRKKESKLDFPWEPGAGQGQQDPALPPEPEPPPAPEKKEKKPEKEGRGGFQGEKTREYLLSDGFVSPSARSEISLDSPDAVEDTREVQIPKGALRERTKPTFTAEEHWPRHQGFKARFKKRFYEDPLVRWYMAFPASTRGNVARALWILTACWMIVGIYFWSTLVVHPLFENYLRPLIAPRPEQALRAEPRDGLAFDLVEDREYDGRNFKMGTDWIWLTRDRDCDWEVASERVSLVYDGKSIAELDLRKNWDGLLRVYFGVGELIPKTPLYVRIPMKDGGMWPLTEVPDYRLLRRGGTVPSYVLVGPVYFNSD